MKKSDYIMVGAIIAVIFIILSIYLGLSLNNKYDISKMNEISVKEALDLFEKNETSLIFFGRESCSVCQKLLPVLNEVQLANNLKINYIDITKVDRTSTDWETLVSKLDIQSSATLSETLSDEAEVVSESYGYFIDNYGFTPMIVMIKDGEQKAGFIGTKTIDEFNTWYNYFND